jgi:CHAT domain-containing protein
VKKYIKPGESLISTYSGPDKTYIWIINKDKPIHFYTSDIGYDALEHHVSRLYAAFSPSENSLNGITAYNVNLAYRLFEKLFKPSVGLWNKSHTLYIAGHGALGRMPVSALPTRKVKRLKKSTLLFEEYKNVPFLVKTHAVSNIPSVSAFKTLRSINSKRTNRQPLVAFADPFFNEKYANQSVKSAQQLATRGGIKLRSSPATLEMNSAELDALPGLPETASEVKEIARMLNISESAHIFTGQTATEEKVKSLKLNEFETIIFATHGLVPGELNGLDLPALALSSPKITASEGDGLLTADEIMNLKLNADWVILSACNTGSSGNASTEAVSGLGQAFFYAGARALLVSNWPVETNSASLLTVNTFKFLNNHHDRARALQSSMNEIINGAYYDESNNEPVFSYAHPFFWAPFSLVGDTLVSK